MKKYNYNNIFDIVNNYLDGVSPETEMIEFLRSVYNYSLTDEETLYLTDVMIKSGNILDVSQLRGTIVDKHSTGGVGDKTTIIIGCIIAANQIYFPKMSGRSLGHTGGTIDKLLSIPGFKVELSEKEFLKNLNKSYISIISQNENLAPADKLIYDLRNKINTVMSIPLIASSIMSKKIACNADKLIIDVKCGKGALLQTEKECIKLSKLLCKIGKAYNKEVVCIVTNMDFPLGKMVGNSLEIKEIIDILNGNGDKELIELCTYLSGHLISLAKNIDLKSSIKIAKETLSSGNAYKKFIELIENQGGDINDLEISNNIIELKSHEKGFVTNINALKVGEIVSKMSKNNDYTVGIEFIKKVGDYVEKGDLLALIYANDKYSNDLLSAYEIKKIKKRYKLIKYIIKY